MVYLRERCSGIQNRPETYMQGIRKPNPCLNIREVVRGVAELIEDCMDRGAAALLRDAHGDGGRARSPSAPCGVLIHSFGGDRIPQKSADVRVHVRGYCGVFLVVGYALGRIND
jgi:hypothetical protein